MNTKHTSVNGSLDREDTLISVVLADQEEFVRQSIKNQLNSLGSYHVVADCRDAESALRKLEETKAQILITEITLPGMSGIELVRESQRRKLSARSVILTSVQSAATIQQAFGAGAACFLSKASPTDEILRGLSSALENKRFVSPSLESLLPNSSSITIEQMPEVSSDPLSPLSPREREIFYLLASGMQNTTIAKKLFISPRTVETHRARLVRKLGLNTNPELIRFAIKHGLTAL